jgi:hypothetical protein
MKSLLAIDEGIYKYSSLTSDQALKPMSRFKVQLYSYSNRFDPCIEVKVYGHTCSFSILCD